MSSVFIIVIPLHTLQHFQSGRDVQRAKREAMLQEEVDIDEDVDAIVDDDDGVENFIVVSNS